MAARQAKRTFTQQPTDVEDAQLLPRIGADIGDDEYNPDMEAAFEQLREDFRAQNSEGTLWVHRVPLDDRAEMIANGKNVFLFSAPIQRYATEEIYSKVQREYMDGMRTTCIRVSATKKGERGVRFNHLVMVERPAQPDKPPPETGALQLGSIGEIVRVIQEGQQAMLVMLQRAVQPPAHQQAAGMQPQIDTIRSLAEIMYLMNGGTRPAGGAAPAPAPPSVLDQLKTLRELRGFVGELAGGDATDVGAEASADGPLAVLKHLSPWARVFGQLLSANARQQPASRRMPPPRGAAPGRVQLPQSGTPAPEPAANPGIAPMTPIRQSQPPEGDQVLAQLRNEFEALTRAAQEGGTPEDVAPVVLQMIPAGSAQEELFMSFLDDPQWFRRLCGVYPPAAPYEQWFTALRTAILAEFEDGGGTTIEGGVPNETAHNP